MTAAPKRIQRKRTAGWRMPDGSFMPQPPAAQPQAPAPQQPPAAQYAPPVQAQAPQAPPQTAPKPRRTRTAAVAVPASAAPPVAPFGAPAEAPIESPPAMPEAFDDLGLVHTQRTAALASMLEHLSGMAHAAAEFARSL